MAKHVTHKTTTDGKRQTQTRRATRRAKYHTADLDTARLMRELAKG